MLNNCSLRAAKVLLIGLNGFGAEIAKNIILAGVKAVTFLDHRNVTAEDRCSQFLAPTESLGKNVSKKVDCCWCLILMEILFSEG